MKRSGTFHVVVASMLAIMMFVLSFQGCASTQPIIGEGADPKKSAMICGATGALVGAAAGATIGGAAQGGRGAAAGAAIGALTGLIVAATACFTITYRSQGVESYEKTSQEVAYRPSQGNAVQITEFQIAPAAAGPGDQVKFQASYYVMTADPDREISVTETRVVAAVNSQTGERKELGRDSTPVTVKPGMRRGDGQFHVGSGVPEGRYEVTFIVEAADRRDAQKLPFLITKDQTARRDPARQIARVTAEPAGAKMQAARGEDPKEISRSVAAEGARGSSTAVGRVSPTPVSAPASGAPLALWGEATPALPPSPTQARATVVPAPGSAGTGKIVKDRYFVASQIMGKGVLRAGPGTNHKVVGEIAKDERYVLIQTESQGMGTWHKIRLDDGREAWVMAALGEIQE